MSGNDQETRWPCACRFERDDESGRSEQIEHCFLHAQQRDEIEGLRTALVFAASLIETGRPIDGLAARMRAVVERYKNA